VPRLRCSSSKSNLFNPRFWPTADEEALGHAIHAGGMLRLPRRVLLPLDPLRPPGLLLSDYLLPGEEPEVSMVHSPRPPWSI
jgi:hypothetical protein